MINFRVNQIAVSLSGAALMSMLAMSILTIDGQLNVTRAQRDAPTPRRLLPRTTVVPESPSEIISPTPASPKIQSGIEVNRLERLDPQEFGTIDALSGGLARDMWAGTSSSLAAKLLGQLPSAIASPSLREVLRRALLTSATLPVKRPDNPAVNFAALRISQLQLMGLLGSAAELLDAAPNRKADHVLHRLHAENLLMGNDIATACAETQRPETDLAERYWQYLLIFCHVVENNLAEAALGVSILAEGKEPIDPGFMLLIDGFVSGVVPKVDAIGRPTALLLAMLRYAKLPVPDAALARAPPPLLVMIAGSMETDLDLRLAAAEKAVREGAMTTDWLTRIYVGAQFSREELDNALSTAQAAQAPRGRALLYQAAYGQNVPTARAEVLRKALDFAAENGFYSLSTRIYQAMLESMVPSVELSWFAADAIRALSALGRLDLVRPWLNGLRYQSARDPAAKLALDSLWAMATLASVKDATVVAAGSFGDWCTAIEAVVQETANSRIKVGMALLEIAGQNFEGAQWEAALKVSKPVSVRLSDYAYRVALRRAAAAGRLAETILLSAIVVGGDRLGELDLSLLAEVVDALRRVGLDQEAHALVLEAAVEKGI